MKRNLKSVAKFAAVGFVCTALVGGMSGNVNTVVESNDVAGISCAMQWCDHKAIKNVSLSSV